MSVDSKGSADGRGQQQNQRYAGSAVGHLPVHACVHRHSLSHQRLLLRADAVDLGLKLSTLA